MKKQIIVLSSLFTALVISLALMPRDRRNNPENIQIQANEIPEEAVEEKEPSSSKRIYLALLLDTSNSMDGLIDQAKSQLWNIVDEMTNARYDDQPVDLHLALYEYGNDNLSIRSGYVRQVSPFSQDLDEISTQLFALKTNGGSEFCGTVIRQSLDQLQWGDDQESLKIIFIAGNEPFDQGEIPFENSCKQAAEKGIIINTIFCGNYQEGINTNWKKGASLADGSYMNIDMDQKTVYVATPYDQTIDSLNTALNDTYIGYGVQGAMRKEKQLIEDQNAATYSQQNKVKRAISKSKHVYKNSSWDLVDAVEKNGLDITTLEDDDFPKEMKTMSIEQRKVYINTKMEERKKIQSQIKTLALSREKYVKQVQDSLSTDNELENAIVESVKSKAREKSFVFKD